MSTDHVAGVAFIHRPDHAWKLMFRDIVQHTADLAFRGIERAQLVVEQIQPLHAGSG